MKVLLVITGLGMGGAEHVVVNLADELVNRGHEVKIAYLTGLGLVLPSNENIEVIALNMNEYQEIVPTYLKLNKLIRAFKPDVVHGHMFHANILTRLLKISTKIPKLISSAHSTNEGGKTRMLAYRVTDKLADISTNVSDEAVSTFIRKGAVKTGRMVSVTNGIDIIKFSFDKIARKNLRAELNIENKKALLAVGRLDTPKDYPNLLNAVHLLNKNRQDFKLFIAGDGPLRGEIEQLAAKLEINDIVEFLGIRRDVHNLMSASDVFVLSSAWEGFGLVVAEAMSCERIVVATDCGGVAEVVGDAGIIVPPKNSKQLASALNKALDMSEEESLILGCKARQHIVDNYSLDRNVNSYLELYLQ